MTRGRGDEPGEIACPRCRKHVTPVRIAYGYPSFEMFEAAERGEIRLGGCIVDAESPDYACPACDALLPFVAPENQLPQRPSGIW